MLTLVPADERDWARLWYWRNDPQTRAHSASGDAEVDLPTHRKWLTETLKKPSVRIYIACDQSIGVVGTGRLEARNKTTVELSLTVDPSRRGQGYGQRIVGELLDRARKEFPEVTTLKARVKPTNVPSLRAFASHGFVPTGERDGILDLARATVVPGLVSSPGGIR